MPSVARTTNVVSERGERFSIDLSSIKNISLGGAKYWLLIVDHSTGYKKSFFLHAKDQVAHYCYLYIKKLRAEGYPVRFIRCDNAGENTVLEKRCAEEGLNITFEYTTPYVPQYNGVVERVYATLYGHVRAMLNDTGFDEPTRNSLWAEAANTATHLDNITVNEKTGISPYEAFFKKQPKDLGYLRTFGEKGYMVNPKGIKSKLEDRGIEVYFVRYAENHASDVYRVYDPTTKRTKISKTVRWIKKPYCKPVNQEINQEDKKQEQYNHPVLTIPLDAYGEDYKDNSKEPTLQEQAEDPKNTRLRTELCNLNTFYNPTMESSTNQEGRMTLRSTVQNNIQDFVLFCRVDSTAFVGTDNVNSSGTEIKTPTVHGPVDRSFYELWNHKDPTKCNK